MSSNIEGLINQDFVDQQVALTAVEGTGETAFDSEMFIRLLITQLQNQDPFNTVETQEIMNQQAVLAEVEQSIKQTESLDGLKETVDTSLLAMSDTLNEINSALQTLINAQNGSDSSGDQQAGG